MPLPLGRSHRGTPTRFPQRVALCSMRNGCSRDLLAPEQKIRDFDVVWLEDYLDELIVPKLSEDRCGEI